MNLGTLLHMGDALAIIGFALLIRYFLQKTHRTKEETVLLCFSIAGLVADVVFTTCWLTNIHMQL